MNPVRKRRLILVGLVLLAASVAAVFITLALQENINYLHTPTEVRTGKAPADGRFRLGGVVCLGSVQRAEGTLDVRFNGKSVADVLRMSVAEALGFFAAQTRLRRPLEALRDTGLEYLELGQTSPTLSGGEAQRIKLVTHLQS